MTAPSWWQRIGAGAMPSPQFVRADTGCWINLAFVSKIEAWPDTGDDGKPRVRIALYGADGAVIGALFRQATDELPPWLDPGP